MANKSAPKIKKSMYINSKEYRQHLLDVKIWQITRESAIKNRLRAAKRQAKKAKSNLDNDEYIAEITEKVEKKQAEKQELENFKKESKDLAEKILAVKMMTNPIKLALHRAQTGLRKKMEKAETTEERQSYARGVLAWNIAEQAGESAMNVADVGLQRYLSLHEDYMTNQFISNAKGTINRIKSFGSSVIQGAQIGAIAGPAGAAIGAAVGTLTSVVNLQMQYQQRMSGYYQQLNATNFQTEYNASKLGLAGSSGTEN